MPDKGHSKANLYVVPYKGWFTLNPQDSLLANQRMLSACAVDPGNFAAAHQLGCLQGGAR